LAKPKTQPFIAERPGTWHLARTETERRLSDFEFGLERILDGVGMLIERRG